MTAVTFNVRGMSCTGCAQSIERRLLTTAGVQSASVDLSAGAAVVDYDENVTTTDSLEKVIESLGFDVLYNTGKTKTE